MNINGKKMVEGININNSNSKMVFKTQNVTYSVRIFWTMYTFNKSDSYEMSLTIQVQYYGYNIGILIILTVRLMSCSILWNEPLNCTTIYYYCLHTDAVMRFPILVIFFIYWKTMECWFLEANDTWESWQKTWFKALKIISMSNSTGSLKDIWQLYVIYINVAG